MKNFGKRSTALIFSICIGTSLMSVDASATNTFVGTRPPIEHVTESTQFDQQITPYSDIIGWRYKTEKGNMYRRQYNYSKQEWIGEWELC